MASTTLQGNNFLTSFAIAMAFEPNRLMAGLGQSTAWTDGITPPPSNTTGLPNPIVYKLVDTVALCKAVNEGDPHEYSWVNNGTSYYFKTVTESEAATDHARWVYLEVTFNPGVGSLSSFDYRAVAFYYNLIPDTGYENETVWLPAEVASVGNLMLIAHIDDGTTVGGAQSATIKYAIQVGG